MDKDREELFDEDVLKFSNKLANLETHPKLRRSLLTFVRGKGQVRLQDDKMLPDNFLGGAIEQDESGWYTMMEVRVERSWHDIQ